MKIKSILLGSSAVIGVVGGAQAADVAAKPAVVTKPAPVVQYVQVCDLYGIGYFIIPGQKDTCLRVQGQVTFALNFHSMSAEFYGSGSSSPHSAGWDSQVTGQLTFTAKRQTDHGDLIGVVRLTSTSNNANTVAVGQPATAGASCDGLKNDACFVALDRYVQMDRAYIQLGSKFTVLVGYNSSIYGVGTTKQISLGFDLGGGTQFQLGLDDPRDRWGSRLPDVYQTPDIVGNLQGAYALGTWGAGFGVGEVADNKFTGTPPVSFYGPGNYGPHIWVYGLSARTTINTPFIAKGDQLTLAGLYGTGCQFVSCTDLFSFSTPANTPSLSDHNTAIWQAAVGFKHVFSSQLNTAVTYQYNKTNGKSAVGKGDFWSVTSTTQWVPTNERNLQVQFQAKDSQTYGSTVGQTWTGQAQLVWAY